MIITKTPLRMSFVGGGSDVPAFYRRHGGAVLSSTIDQYVFVLVNRKFDQAIRVSYSKTEEVKSALQLEHPLVRAALSKLNISGGIEITSVADIPSRGTGLGSSSSFTVGLLHALHAFKGIFVSADALGRQSCEIEIDICKEPIGKQDQFAAAFGGLNFIQFHPDDTVAVEPIICRSETVQKLQDNLLVFYTGITRRAATVLAAQNAPSAQSRKHQQVLRRMVELAHSLKRELQNNALDAFGEILHENWLLKRSLADEISNAQIDCWYEKGMRAGALGGKLLGAGGGGFLLFYAPKESHRKIADAMPELLEVAFKFERSGSRIIFVH